MQFSTKTTLVPFLILIVSSLLPHFTDAQILNIERYRLQRDSTKNFIAKATGGLNIYNRSASAESPVNLFGYNWDFNSMYQPGKHAFVFVSKFDYLKINDSDFLNFGLLHGRVVFNRDRKSHLEAYTQYSFDNFRGLAPRWIVGGSWRQKVINSTKSTLIVGIGALKEWETWENPLEEEFVRVSFIKSANYLSLRQSINDFVDLNTVIYFQTGYDSDIRTLRNRLSGNINLNTKITDILSFTNSFEFSYEDKPIVPITPFIFAFRTGISLDF
ncbi:DUF481 domain-containing protein [Mongoliitalea daihaiensis]|uniref:DUF481 domain-containing protein n=1 Tax=Mongoliitalea daihaiensis TaxID=2782006 RepID=UPI001F16AB5A|nr:DUF481 domain-containing protein [Mongoliitalea daihaiensis]